MNSIITREYFPTFFAFINFIKRNHRYFKYSLIATFSSSFFILISCIIDIFNQREQLAHMSNSGLCENFFSFLFTLGLYGVIKIYYWFALTVILLPFLVLFLSKQKEKNNLTKILILNLILNPVINLIFLTVVITIFMFISLITIYFCNIQLNT